MKQISLLMLSAVLMLGSCSKSNDSKPKEEKPTIVIEGQAYETINIGSQTWTAVNYNGKGGVNYNNGTNDPKYGKLYTITEAKAIQLPEGWRLPTWEDYNNLLKTARATSKNESGVYEASEAVTKKLMAKAGWDNNIGTNEAGFNAYPAGNYANEYSWKGTDAVFLTSSTFDQIDEPSWTNIPVSFVISLYEDDITNKYSCEAIFSDYVVEKEERGSIRFVKDN